MLNVVKRPFKTGGKIYPAGTIIDDPAGIKLFKTKVREGKIMLVDEHNLLETANYLKHRRGVDVEELVAKVEEVAKLNKAKKEELEAAVKEAENYGIDVNGKTAEQLNNEIAIEKQKEAYTAKVYAAAEKYKVNVEGKSFEDVVAEVKAKQEEAKKDK